MRSTFILVLALCPLFLLGQPFVKYHQPAGIADSISGHPYPNYPQWGCGVSAVDFNNDGYDDLTIATGHGRRLLFYTNNGDGTFTKIPPMVKYKFHTKMVLWVDYDNDGDKDLFLTGWQRPNRLYRNDGGPKLVDVTETAGLPISDDWTWGASFGDYNNDGHLDLYVCNREKELYSNYLYHNNGDGTFSDVTEATKSGDETQLTFQSIFWDYNNDGYQDLYMANDRLYGNSLYKNNGFGVYADVSIPSGAGVTIDAMNTGAGDFNNDGYWDMYVTNTPAGGNALLKNNGDETFTDIATSAGVRFFDFTWGGNWFDYDNDTDVDLYVSCMSPRFDRHNALYVNEFVDAGTETFGLIELPYDTVGSFSNAYLDFDEDGKMDLVVPNNASDSIYLWKNVDVNSNNYIKFTLEGTVSNRDGIGTIVELWIGGQKYLRSLFAGDAYISQNTNKIHFGLGSNVAVDSVVFRWLSGLSDKIVNPAINSTHHIVENSTNALTYIQSQTDALCKGAADGTATVTPSGVPPYTYVWSTGHTGATATGLAKGRCMVTVEDNNGDRAVAVFHIDEPDAMALSFSAVNETSGSTGSIDLSVMGGTMPFTYNWDNGAMVEDPTGLTAGVYSVDVTDNNGCVVSGYWGVYNDDAGACQTAIMTSVEPTTNSAQFTWLPVPDVLAYRVRYREQGTMVWTNMTVREPDVTVHATGLTPGVTYEYEIVTRCQTTGTSAYSATETFTTLMNGPSFCDSFVPTLVAANDNSVLIDFDDMQNASRYRVRYREVGGGAWSGYVSSFAMIVIQALNPGTMYEFNTSTYCDDQGGWSGWSSTTYNFTTTSSVVTVDEKTFEDKVGKEALDLALEGASTEMLFQMRPNPAFEFVRIEVMNGVADQIIVRDASGKIVAQKQATDMVNEVNIAGLPAGFYFITVTGNYESVTQRLIKID